MKRKQRRQKNDLTNPRKTFWGGWRRPSVQAAACLGNFSAVRASQRNDWTGMAQKTGGDDEPQKVVRCNRRASLGKMKNSGWVLKRKATEDRGG